jgi:hypothetical protein
MTDEVLTQAPEAGATPVAPETTPAPAPVRGPDGKFASQAQDTPAIEPSATTEEPDAKTEKVDEPKRSRVAERINQLTAEKHSAQREAQALREQLSALQRAPRPDVDPNDYDAVQRESVRGVFREEQFRQTALQVQAAEAKARSAQIEAFDAKIQAARERIPNIDQSTQLLASPNIPFTEAMFEIVSESDHAAEVAHYLASNINEVFEIARMTPAQQGRALARIEAKVNLPTRRTSSAPPPPPTVTGAQAARERSPAEMSAAEYVAHRKQQWAKGSR